jgi:CRP-like cAMP-binding protein
VRRLDAVMSEYTPPTPVEGFVDPDDPILFPRLTAAQIEQLAESAETLSLSPGEVLFKQGQRDTPLYVVLSGAIDVIDRQPEGDRYFAQCRPGTFAADTSMFTGEPTLARGVAAEETSVLALPARCARWWPVPRSWGTCSCARWSHVVSG